MHGYTTAMKDFSFQAFCPCVPAGEQCLAMVCIYLAYLIITGGISACCFHPSVFTNNNVTSMLCVSMKSRNLVPF